MKTKPDLKLAIVFMEMVVGALFPTRLGHGQLRRESLRSYIRALRILRAAEVGK